jgi:membrane fusion protein, multidrug efflux system
LNTTSPSASPAPPAQALPTPPLAAEKGPHFRLFTIAGLTALAVVLLILGAVWWSKRQSHSIAEDAFVEAHIVNVAPELVSGHIVSFFVEENSRVQKGQVIAEIDSESYRDQVELAHRKVEAAQAELIRQEAALARLRIEVPIQIEISRRTLAAAKADEARAQSGLKLTEDEVEHGIEEAQAGLDAATADLLLAQQDFDRFTNLQKEEAVSLRRAQEATQARDAAEAHRKLAATKLAKAKAERTQIEVAKQTAEAAAKTALKAAKGVDLASTGTDQIHEVELLAELKRVGVAEAKSALDAAQHQLEHTQIRAPFPGIVVKRYRNLGDFASAGVPILSMYNPDLVYVTANLEETRLGGVAPGNAVELQVDAFADPFHGRVVWIDKSTGAQFALLPRNVVAGEFTKVVQRVPVRIAIDKDDRWPLLRAGLSVRAVISHGAGDASAAQQAEREMADLESRYNLSKE